MGLFRVFGDVLFATKVVNSLVDLGLNPNNLSPATRKLLHEIERSLRKTLSAKEAAAYFIALHGPLLTPNCFLPPARMTDGILRAVDQVEQWALGDLVRPVVFTAFIECVRLQHAPEFTSLDELKLIWASAIGDP